MLKAKFVSDYTLRNIDDIKIAALYYDEIDIKEITLDFFVDSCIEEGFKESLDLLVQEGIVNYIPDSGKSRALKLVMDKLDLFFNYDFDKSSIYFNPEEATELLAFLNVVKLPETISLIKKIMKPYYKDIDAYDGLLISMYYSIMLRSLFESMSSDCQTITSSKILNAGVNRYFNSDYFNSKKKHLNHLNLPTAPLAFEAIKIALPNVSRLSIEDILEIRLKLKDELMFFRYQMEETQNQISRNVDYQNLEQSLSSIIDDKINVPLMELERKMKSSHLKAISKLLTELKSFKSYTPFIGTFFGGLPTYVAALTSLGLVGTSTYLEVAQQKNEIKNNGMYYLLDLKKNYNPK